MKMPKEKVCDICGTTCKKKNYCDNEYAVLKATLGYNSKKDLEKHKCVLCESCYDKVRKFIEEILSGTIHITNYGG
jgi:tRNA U54 and U55 pseudouridine synthase Pus10